VTTLASHFAVSDLHVFVGVYYTLFNAQLSFVQQNEFKLEFRFYKRSSNFRKKTNLTPLQMNALQL